MTIFEILVRGKNWLLAVPCAAWVELVLRLFLMGIFLAFEFLSIPPYARVIQPEEAWLYKFPSASSSFVSSRALSWLMISSCVAIMLIAYGINRKIIPGLQALLVPTLAIPLTGVITNILKIIIGRPRPDYFNRCYGDGYMMIKDVKKKCTGNIKKVQDGLKSFPSGHSSLSFCALGFISVYLASQLQTFVIKGSGSTWRLIVTLIPFLAATLVAVSRMCDYHHHWQDVTVGAVLGFTITYVVFRQYFPPLTSPHCQFPYPFLAGDRAPHVQFEMASTSSIASQGPDSDMPRA